MDREEMILSNLRLVHYIVRKMHYPPTAYYDYDDLVQEGNVALIEAVDRFNPELGFSFATYASAYIRGKLLTFINHNHALKYTRNEQQAIVRVSRSGDAANPDDVLLIAKATAKDREIVQSMFTVPLDSPITSSEDGNLTIEDMLGEEDKELDMIGIEEDIERIRDQLLTTKRENHREVLEEWYLAHVFGFKCGQKELSRKYGLSQSYVSRIINQFKREFYEALRKNGYYITLEEG